MPNRTNGGGTKDRGWLPRYDIALRNAKNEGHKVKFQLPLPTWFTDDDDTVTASVVEVDKYAILICTDEGREIWIPKSVVGATEVLK